MSETIG